MGSLPVFGGARVRGRTVCHSSAIWDHLRYLVGHVLTVCHSSAIWDHSRYLVGHVLGAELFTIRVPSGTTPGFWWGTC
jgi:hypothetical protein